MGGSERGGALADRFQTFLLDLDGVVYVGDELLPGARASLRGLRERGKTLRFLTNDPRPTRSNVVQRLDRLGIDASLEEVVTCGWCSAAYLSRAGIRTAHVLGSDGLRRELALAGIGSSDGEDAEAVVVGCDERIGYTDIRRAARLIRRGARFVATNDDPTFPTPEGPAPATGTIVAAVRTASGAAPRIVGKPHPAMFEAALGTRDPNGAVMIGDSLASDIVGARQTGTTAVLLAREPGAAQPAENLESPDLVISTLAELHDGTSAIEE